MPVLVIPLNPAALARIDKLDRMIAELERGLPKLKRDDRHKCQTTIRALRADFIKECVEDSMRVNDIAPTQGKGTAGFRVTRYANGRAKALVWDSAARR